MQGKPDIWRGLAVDQEGSKIFLSDTGNNHIKVSKMKGNFSLRFQRAETVNYLVCLLPRVADPALGAPCTVLRCRTETDGC